MSFVLAALGKPEVGMELNVAMPTVSTVGGTQTRHLYIDGRFRIKKSEPHHLPSGHDAVIVVLEATGPRNPSQYDHSPVAAAF